MSFPTSFARLTGLALPVALLLALQGATPARAAVTLGSAQRSIEVEWTAVEALCAYGLHPYCPPSMPYTETVTDGRSDLSDFDAVVTPVDPYAAWAQMRSTIDAYAIEGDGTTYAGFTYELYLPPQYLFEGKIRADTVARSDASITFTVDEPTPFTLEGAWDAQAALAYGWTARIELIGPSGSVAEVPCIEVVPGDPYWGCANPGQVETGMLDPGSYTLFVETSASGYAGEWGGPPDVWHRMDYSYRLGLGAGAQLPALGPWAHGIVGALMLGLGLARLYPRRAPSGVR